MNKILAKLNMRTYITVMLVGEIIIAVAGILSGMSFGGRALIVAIYAAIVMISFSIVFKIKDKIEFQPGE